MGLTLMGWLKYSDDEVQDFHPEFESIALQVLDSLGMKDNFEWVHHDASAKGGIPDFVLRAKGSNQWILVVEIKKTRNAVTSSTHYRRQAHSYALENKFRFRYGRPFLYCLSNLEQTQLFGANDDADLAVSPNARQIAGWNHGDFAVTPTDVHKSLFDTNLRELVQLAIGATVPIAYRLNFPITWDAIQSAGVSIGGVLPVSWSDRAAGSWFSGFGEQDSKGLLLAVRCLLAEWIVYQCEQHDHPRAARMVRLQLRNNASKTRNYVADALDRILQIDFDSVIGGSATTTDLRCINNTGALLALQGVIEQIQHLELAQLSDLVGNSGLPDLLFDLLQDRVKKARRGTVQTDPELAQVAAILGFHQLSNPKTVVDPCAGIGNLLVAAFHELSGVKQDIRLASISAIEIDPIQACLSSLQLTMQLPALASTANQPSVICDSMFNRPDVIASADLILLNPPYKRYEDDGDPLPDGFRESLGRAIQALKGKPASTTGGQADLYNFYVEFVVSAMSEGSRGVFVLNNKWMNTKTTLPLRRFLAEECRIEGIIQYPSGEFFEGHLIMTSLLVLTKGKHLPSDNCRFVRCQEDLRLIRAADVATATFDGTSTAKVQVSSHLQTLVLTHTNNDSIGSWRSFFPKPACLATLEQYPKLVDLFDSVSQGRLERDEVSKVFSFPFRNWEHKGTCREDGKSTAYIAGSNRTGPLGSVVPNSTLVDLTAAAAAIPDDYRGLALKVSNKMGSDLNFELAESNFSHSYADGSSDAIIEPPDLRSGAWDRGPMKAKWTKEFEDALDAMRAHKIVGRFINLVEQELGGKHRPTNIIWEDLLRPCAGELILLRSFRAGWRAHLNPLAFNPQGRQARLSSNFYSFRGLNCILEGDETEVSHKDLTTVILAFLVSSFGQIQFEVYGENREGLRKCETATCIDKIRVPNPLSISKEKRSRLIELLSKISCPIRCEAHPHADSNRRTLDIVVAEHMLDRDTHDIEVLELVDRVALELDELQRERLG